MQLEVLESRSLLLNISWRAVHSLDKDTRYAVFVRQVLCFLPAKLISDSVCAKVIVVIARWKFLDSLEIFEERINKFVTCLVIIYLPFNKFIDCLSLLVFFMVLVRRLSIQSLLKPLDHDGQPDDSV